MLRIFIGFDPRQPVAYQVLHHSIIRRSSKPVSITPLVLGQLPLKRTGLTPFTFSRYLVPWLCGFEGTALFLDTDILVLGDIADLFSYADESKAVVVSKNPLRFEWASVMLFNCAHRDNRVLTPDHVESADQLHMIGWTEHVGEFPGEWNHLVMYDQPKRARLVHYTAGIPIFPETKDLGYAEEWNRERKRSMSTVPWRVLMAGSVHATHVYERLRQAAVAKGAVEKSADEECARTETDQPPR